MNIGENASKQGRSKIAVWLIRGPVHLLGVVAVAAATALPFVNQWTLKAIWDSLQYREFLAVGWLEFVLHLGLAACLWATIVLLFEILTARRQPVRRLLSLERGSVMTETLIVLPVFLLLTFGIAQLAINNVAGIVANAAGFQAGRTYWLWSAEDGINRAGTNKIIDKPYALEMAHVQAAAVLAPVAPGDFEMRQGGLSEQAEQMRAILLASQIPIPSKDSGALVKSSASAMVSTYNSTKAGRGSTFNNALGMRNWHARTVRQFTFAYHAIDVRKVESGGEVGVRMEYWHHQAFPLVARIFGEGMKVGQRGGYYSKITRVFTMPTQIAPNPK